LLLLLLVMHLLLLLTSKLESSEVYEFSLCGLRRLLSSRRGRQPRGDPSSCTSFHLLLSSVRPKVILAATEYSARAIETESQICMFLSFS
jgi:hypothetical protein